MTEYYVNTSLTGRLHFNRQVQAELAADRHPVILVSGGDIARLLVKHDIAGPALERWLDSVRLKAKPATA